MVKNSKFKCGKSRISIFINTHVHCLTLENMYLTTSLYNHFYSILENQI